MLVAMLGCLVAVLFPIKDFLSPIFLAYLKEETQAPIGDPLKDGPLLPHVSSLLFIDFSFHLKMKHFI